MENDHRIPRQAHEDLEHARRPFLPAKISWQSPKITEVDYSETETGFLIGGTDAEIYS